MEAAREQELRRCIGRRFVLTGLQSERGQEINGKLATVIGFEAEPEVRLHVKVPSHPKVPNRTFKVRYGNLLVPDSEMTLGGRLDGPLRENVLRIGRDALPQLFQNVGNGDNRPDWGHRAQRLQDAVAAWEKGSSLELCCGEVGDRGAAIIAGTISHPNGDFIKQMYAMKPPCVGDGKFRLDQLLAGGADEGKARDRFLEYLPSGFCVPCQMRYMEHNHFVTG